MRPNIKIACVRGFAAMVAVASALLWLSRGGGSIKGAVICFGYALGCLMFFAGSFLRNQIGYWLLVATVPLVFAFMLLGFDLIIFFKGDNVASVCVAFVLQMILPMAVLYVLVKDGEIKKIYR